MQATTPRFRWALPALLLATAALYLWDLSGCGWANSFYSAAAQAGSQSWKAFLFGSSDAANSIAIDKPPLSVWPAALFVRAFGLNPWSILVPQALMGVAAVALLYDAVRRVFGEIAGLTAGLVLACTPVAVALFRFNNPDALLTLLAIAAVWAVLRAVGDGRTRWLALSGLCVGLGFLTKQLQVVLIVPALACTYLVAGPPALATRLRRSAVAATAAILSAGWWVLMVQLWPADRRPWIGGTRHNSILELTLGYNGLGRLDGNEPGSVMSLGQSATAPTWGHTGPGRMFQPAQIGEIGWMLPAALLFLVVLLVWRWRAPRPDPYRAQVVAWGLLLLCTCTVFSLMAGIFHPYYTVTLAPAIAALVGIGTVVCWRHVDQWWGWSTLAAATALTAATAYWVLRRFPDYHPWLRWTVLCAAAVAFAALLVPRLRQAWIPVVLVALAVAGPMAYSVTTVQRGNFGALPTAGPLVNAHSLRLPVGPTLSLNAPGRTAHIPGCTLMAAGAPRPNVVARLNENADAYRWVAATVGSMCAAGYQLASGHPVLPVGGFNGTDPAPAPDQFLRWALSKRIHWFIVSNPVMQDPWGHLDDAALIQQWVQRNFAPVVVDRVLMYDLTSRR